MSYTLPELAEDVQKLLSKTPVSECADQLCAVVSKALNDQDFIEQHLTERSEGEGPRKILFEHSELGFCICGHVYGGQAIGNPHDHGPSWAIYGQAVGTTEMIDWEIVELGEGDKPTLVTQSETYLMNAGDAHFYDVGDVHSPKRDAPTKLIRLEGENLDNVKRSKIAEA